MLRFFRNIRKTLMEQNKVRSYTFYAIGEILLVVIGILIALQVNNWNEERLLEKEVDAILVNLNRELLENLELLNRDTKRLDNLITGLTTLLEMTHQQNTNMGQSEFDQLLETTLSAPTWLPSSVVLEELKFSGGFSRLNDDELVRLLFDWERHYLSQQYRRDKGYLVYVSEYIEYLSDNGSVRNMDHISGNFKGLKPSVIATNNISMLKDPQFENRLDNFYALAVLVRRDYAEAAEKIKVIVDHIGMNR